MQVNHLHLHVKDLDASQRYYETYFGFREHTYHGPILFLRNEDDFDLALAPDETPEALPPWFHFGCRLASADDVVALLERMKADGAGIAKDLYRDETLASFRAADPDGHQIEIYWE